MDSFSLNGTEFGIDRQESSIAFTPASSGVFMMDLVIHGDELTYAKLAEEAEWSWSLYAPQFYLHSYPAPSNETLTVHLTANDCEDYGTAIYMIEHNPIESMAVMLEHDSEVTINGKVEMSGKMVAFAIHWSAAKADA